MFLLWLVFALIYQLVPNTKIHFGAALVGGIVGGTLWHLNSVFGFLYVSRVVSNSKIYGSLGLVPVFMAGLYFSWLILLFGAQVAYAFQNRRAYLQDKLVENVNQRGREFIALRLMTCIGQRFQHGRTAGDAPGHFRRTRHPDAARATGVATACSPRASWLRLAATNPATHPRARSTRSMPMTFSTRCARAAGRMLPMRDEPGRAEVLGEFARIEEAEQQAASAITMLALVNRADAERALTGPEIKKSETT